MQNVNYTEKLKARFARDGGKLFFVDGSKTRALSSVKSIIADEHPESQLFIVKDVVCAEQLRAAMAGPSKDEITVISSKAAFEALYKTLGVPADKAQSCAVEFRKKYPKLIVTLEGGSNFTLHSEICKNQSKAGEYNEGDYASYCISDLLSDAGYAFLMIDDVCSMFNFKEIEREKAQTMTPQKYERVDLMGKIYFTDINHSYKKLSRIVDGSIKSVVISNLLVDRDLISLYAGLSLINNNFSYKAAKEFTKSRTTYITQEIDEVCASISYFDNDTILSLCLQYTRNNPQIVPTDLDSLSEYFTGNLNFMTHEEIFLKTVYLQAKKRFSLNIQSNQAIIRSLEEDANIAASICEMFFADSVKGDIEKNLKNTEIAKMSLDEIKLLIEVFSKYGELCELDSIGDRCKIVRIYHEDSAFEDLVRRTVSDFDKSSESFSASHKGDDMHYKCIATSNLIASEKLKRPILIVSAGENGELCKQFNKISEAKANCFVPEQTRIDGSDVLIMNFDQLGALSNNLGIGSAVFFDVLPDINLLDTYVRKILADSGDTNVTVLTTYDDLSGILIDLWQESWFSGEYNILPLRNTDVAIKGDRALDYSKVVGELSSLYESYKLLIEGSDKESTNSLAKKFSDAISNLTLDVSVPVYEMEADFEYFKQISGCYSGIFANSMSISCLGRELFKEVREVESETKNKKKKKRGASRLTPYLTESEDNKVIFNICARQLHEICDYKNHDCVICQNYKKYPVNNFSKFAECADRFFKDSARILADQEEKKRKRLATETIGAAGSVVLESDVSIDEIVKCGKSVTKAIRKLTDKKRDPDAIFYVEYDDIREIHDAVQSIYSRLFGKYYNEIMDIFHKATNKMKTAFETAGQGAKHSAGTL